MSTFRYAARHPKRALSLLATLLLAVGLVAASGAYFTAQSSNPNNTVNAGTLSFTNTNEEGDNQGAIFQVSGLYPDGPSVTRTATISNTGNVPAQFKLNASNFVNPQGILGATRLVIHDVDDNKDIYDGRIDGNLSNIDAGRIADGDEHEYQFTVSIPESGSDQSALMGQTGSVQFDWTATSTQ